MISKNKFFDWLRNYTSDVKGITPNASEWVEIRRKMIDVKTEINGELSKNCNCAIEQNVNMYDELALTSTYGQFPNEED